MRKTGSLTSALIVFILVTGVVACTQIVPSANPTATSPSKLTTTPCPVSTPTPQLKQTPPPALCTPTSTVEVSPPSPMITPTPEIPTCVSPAPPGTILIVNRLSMMVNAVVRPANGTVATGDPANPMPDPGLEYVLITLSITCREEAGTNCTLDPTQEFVLLDTTGVPALPQQGVTGVPGLLGNVTFAGGTKTYGSLLFEVGVEERDLELVYQELGGAADACMALPYWMTVAIVTPTPIPVTPSPSPTPSITPTPAETPTPTPTFTPTPILLPESGLYDAPNAYPIPVTWIFIGGVGALAWFWLRLRSFLSRKD